MPSSTKEMAGLLDRVHPDATAVLVVQAGPIKIVLRTEKLDYEGHQSWTRAVWNGLCDATGAPPEEAETVEVIESSPEDDEGGSGEPVANA